jgi:hypothetical protein
MELVIQENRNSKEDDDLTYNSMKKCLVQASSKMILILKTKLLEG